MPPTPVSARPRNSLPGVGTILQEVANQRVRPGFEYDYQVIVQSSTDAVVMLNAANLFAKHLRRSVVVSVDDNGHLLDISRWIVPPGGTLAEGDYEPFLLADLASLAPTDGTARGRVRISIVGHRYGTFATMARVRRRLNTAVDAILGGCGPVDIVFNLVSCRLFDPGWRLEQSRAGRVAKWCMERADRVQGNGARLRVSVKARRFATAVGQSGKKYAFHVIRPDGTRTRVPINKEGIQALDAIYKTEIIWNNETQKLELRLPTAEHLARRVSQTGSGCPGRCVILDDESEWNPLHEDLLHHLRAALTGPGYVPANTSDRQSRESRLARGVGVLALRERWRTACDQLITHSAGGPYVIYPGDVRAQGAGWQVGLRDVTTPALQPRLWVDASDPVFTMFAGRLKTIAQQLHGTLTLDETGLTANRPESSETDRLGTLDAAFLLMLLSGDEGHQASTDPWDVAVQVQTYAYLVQYSLGLADNTARTLELAALALQRGERPMALLTRATQAVGTLAGPVLDMVALYAAAWQVRTARTDADRLEADANLGMTSLMSGVGLGSTAAELAGATVLAGFLSQLNVPMAGLSIGAGVLVQRYAALADRVVAAARTIQAIAEASRAAKNGLLREGEILRPPAGAVVTCIDLPGNHLRLGDAGLASLVGMTGHVVLGGWDHALSLPTGHGAPESLYRAMGTAPDAVLAALPDGSHHRDNAVLVLPGEAALTLQYDFIQCPGARWKAGCPDVVRILGDLYPERFLWGMFVFPTDYAMASLRPIYYDTTIRIVPATGTRLLVVPRIDNAQMRPHIKYDIALAGSVMIELGRFPVRMTLRTDHALPTPVMLDTTALFGEFDHAGNIQDLKPGIVSNIRAEETHLRVLDQWVGLQGLVAEAVILVTHLPNLDNVQWMMRWEAVGQTHILRHALLAAAPGMMQTQARHIGRLLRQAGVASRYVPAGTHGDTPASGLLDLDSGLCVLLQVSQQGDCTHIERNGVRGEPWPGVVTVAHDLDPDSDVLLLTGRVGDDLAYPLMVDAHDVVTGEIWASENIAARLLAGERVSVIDAAACRAQALEGAAGVAVDREGRDIRFVIEGGMLQIDGIAWLDDAVAYVLHDGRLSAAVSGRQPARIAFRPLPAAHKLHITIDPGTPGLDLQAIPDHVTDIFIVLPTGADLLLILPSNLIWFGRRQQGADLVCQTTSGRRYFLRDAAMSEHHTFDRITVRTAAVVSTLTRLLSTIPALPDTEIGPGYGQYLGTNGSGEHFYLQDREAKNGLPDPVLLSVDQGWVRHFDLHGVEPLGPSQTIIEGEMWLMGVSGLCYSTRGSALVMAGLMDPTQQRQLRLPPSAAADYVLADGSRAFHHTDAIYVHVRGSGVYNATVLCIRPSDVGAAISILARGRPDLGHHVLYLAKLDASLVSGSLVRGKGELCESSLLLPHEVSAMRTANGRIEIEARDNEGLRVAYTGYIQDGRFFRQRTAAQVQ